MEQLSSLVPRWQQYSLSTRLYTAESTFFPLPQLNLMGLAKPLHAWLVEYALCIFAGVVLHMRSSGLGGGTFEEWRKLSASHPGFPSRILSRSFGENFSPTLRDKIWNGKPGFEARKLCCGLRRSQSRPRLVKAMHRVRGGL